MRRTLNFSRVVMTVCLCIAGKLLSAGNLSDRNIPKTMKYVTRKLLFTTVMVSRLLLTCISPKMQKVNCRQSPLAARLVR